MGKLHRLEVHLVSRLGRLLKRHSTGRCIPCRRERAADRRPGDVDTNAGQFVYHILFLREAKQRHEHDAQSKRLPLDVRRSFLLLCHSDCAAAGSLLDVSSCLGADGHHYHEVTMSDGVLCIQHFCSVVLGCSLTLSGRMPLCLSPSRYHSKYGTLRTVQFLARSSRRLSDGRHRSPIGDTRHGQQRRQAHVWRQLRFLVCCPVTESPTPHLATVLASQAAHRRMVWPRGCKVLHVKWYGPSTSKAIGCT